MFSADEGADVGLDAETNVSPDYKQGIANKFTGKIRKVTIEVGPEKRAEAEIDQQEKAELARKAGE